METVPIQPAASTTPTTSPLPIGNEVSSLGDSFAVTLGRALATTLAPAGKPSSPDLQGLLPAKRSARDSSPNDGSTMSGTLFSGFVASAMPPAPPFAVVSGHSDPAAPKATDASATTGVRQTSTSPSAESVSAQTGLAGGTAFGFISETATGIAGATTNQGPLDFGVPPRVAAAMSGPEQTTRPLPVEIPNVASTAPPGIQEPPAPTTADPQSNAVFPAAALKDANGQVNFSSPPAPSKGQSAARAQNTAEISNLQGLGVSSNPTPVQVRSGVQAWSGRVPDNQELGSSAGTTFVSGWPNGAGTIQDSTPSAPKQEFQTLPVPTWPLPAAGQPESRSAQQTTNAQLPATASSDVSTISDLLAWFTGAVVDLKAQVPSQPVGGAAGSVAQSGGIALKHQINLPQAPLSPKAEGPVNNPVEWSLPSASFSRPLPQEIPDAAPTAISGPDQTTRPLPVEIPKVAPAAISGPDQTSRPLPLEIPNAASTVPLGIPEPAPTTAGPESNPVFPAAALKESNGQVNLSPPPAPPKAQPAARPQNTDEISNIQGLGVSSSPTLVQAWSGRVPDNQELGSSASTTFVSGWPNAAGTMQDSTPSAPVQDFQTLPVLTPIVPAMEQPQSASQTTEFPATASSDVSTISDLLAWFTGSVVELKAEAPSQPVGAAGSVAQSGGVTLKTQINPPQVPLSPKAEGPGNNPVKWSSPSASSSNLVAPALTSQKAGEVEVASLRDSLSAGPEPAPPQHFDTIPHPPAPPAGVQGEADSQSGSGHPSATMPSYPTDTAAYPTLPDQATGDQGKSAQQSGSSTMGNMSSPKVVLSGVASPVIIDPGKSLLTTNTPEVSASHDSLPTPPSIPVASTQPPATLAAWQNYQSNGGKVVSSAWLSDFANGAEMHVELRSGTLGPLQVHTIVRDGTVGAEIHVESHEARAILAEGLPSLEKALGERDLRMANVAIYQDHAGAGMSGGGRQNSHAGSSPTPREQVIAPGTTAQPSSSESALEVENLIYSTAGLSVRA
jgi:flagellar hook-length control protein FliK